MGTPRSYSTTYTVCCSIIFVHLMVILQCIVFIMFLLWRIICWQWDHQLPTLPCISVYRIQNRLVIWWRFPVVHQQLRRSQTTDSKIGFRAIPREWLVLFTSNLVLRGLFMGRGRFLLKTMIKTNVIFLSAFSAHIFTYFQWG